MDNATNSHKNGQMWYDVDGNPIQSHGGCIIKFNEKWYWYGENKGQDNVPGTRRVDVIGVSCYSSYNLVDWKYEGLVLSANTENPDSPIHTSKVLERPKVLHNEKTNKFVMWFHSDNAGYYFAGTGIAVSDTPIGPFKLIYATQPNRQESRDMTLFKDDDGTAYLIHSKDWNKTLNIARLTDDYLNVDGFYVSVMVDQEREAPALCKNGNTYYMVTSGCTGWLPNSALYSQSSHIFGKWKLIDNPCEGEGYRTTFGGQSAYIFENNGQNYLMLDHWKPNDLKNSGYSILPITFNNGIMTVNWQETWKG